MRKKEPQSVLVNRRTEELMRRFSTLRRPIQRLAAMDLVITFIEQHGAAENLWQAAVEQLTGKEKPKRTPKQWKRDADARREARQMSESKIRSGHGKHSHQGSPRRRTGPQ